MKSNRVTKALIAASSLLLPHVALAQMNPDVRGMPRDCRDALKFITGGINSPYAQEPNVRRPHIQELLNQGKTAEMCRYAARADEKDASLSRILYSCSSHPSVVAQESSIHLSSYMRDVAVRIQQRADNNSKGYEQYCSGASNR